MHPPAISLPGTPSDDLPKVLAAGTTHVRLIYVSDGAYFKLAGKVASRAAVAGADVIPWRPARDIYVIIEQDARAPATLVDVAGIAGIWWFAGGPRAAPGFPDNSGLQLTYCSLDDDPVAARIHPPLEKRWKSAKTPPLLAAPFHVLVPFEWGRYVP